MRRVLLPIWDMKPITEIGRKDVIRVVYELHDSGKPIAANRLLSYVKKFFSFALQRGLIEASPAALVKKPGEERTRDRVLNDQELCAIWRACDQVGAFGRAFKFMLTTAQRRSEVGSLCWREIDWNARQWLLPASRTKAMREHLLPLSDLALQILDTAPRQGDFVFSTRGARPLSGWGKAKAKLDALAAAELRNIVAEDGEDNTSVTFPEWNLHDLRRSAATNMGKLGVDRFIVARILNHADSEVTAIYDRHRYDREKRDAMDRWAARLLSIIGSGAADRNVVQLTAKMRG
jgi:integrase